MHPNGRAADVVHANTSGSIFFAFMPNLMLVSTESLRTDAKYRPRKITLQVYGLPCQEGNRSKPV
jgi:hypothetical protein